MDEINRKYHEVANIFPLMSGDDFDALKADIAENGQREAIWLHTDGSIIDGRTQTEELRILINMRATALGLSPVNG